MNGSCTSCGVTGGSIEFFDQYAILADQEQKQSKQKDFCNTCVGDNKGNPFDGANFANSLACTDIKCQKSYLGCVYSAQGSVVCNVPDNASKKGDIKETFVPGVMLGGLPNFSPLPKFTSSENNAITKYLY